MTATPTPMIAGDNAPGHRELGAALRAHLGHVAHSRQPDRQAQPQGVKSWAQLKGRRDSIAYRGRVIRDATRDDADAVAELTVAVYVGEGYADPTTSPAYVDALADVVGRLVDCDVLVAETDGRIVGSVTVAAPGTRSADIARPGEVEVRMLAVAPDARRHGVAEELMAQVEERARRAGATAVVLSTDPVMLAAGRLYERRGYRRTPGRDWRVGGKDLITYRLEL